MFEKKYLYTPQGRQGGWIQKNPDYPTKSDQKYLRSTKKKDISHEFYFLPDKINKSNTIYLVEGHNDADRFIDHNYDSLALCTSTISLDGWRALFINNFRNICFCLDNDNAGHHATITNLKTILKSDMDFVIKVANFDLYDAKDPKDCSTKSINNIATNTLNIWDFLSRIYLGKFYDNFIPFGEEEAISFFTEISFSVPNWEIICKPYLQSLANYMGTSSIIPVIKTIQKKKVSFHNYNIGKEIVEKAPLVFEKMGTSGLIEFVNKMSTKIQSLTDLTPLSNLIENYKFDYGKNIITYTG
ncbi:MAG: hypothetical protein QXL94_04065, partial [Candidatus Parvarchaeum sp.]